MDYYTPLTVLVWIALIVLCILAHENDRFSKEKKWILYFTYIIVGFAALFEWLGIQLNGNVKISPWLIRIIKLFDYILTPMAGGFIVLQFQTKDIFKKIIFILVASNIGYQLISFFTGWMIKVDDLNIYSHGPGYNVYIVLYLVITVLVIIEFLLYGKTFRKKNRVSLIAIMLFALTGIVLQEVLGHDVRTAYVSLVICLALLYIHNQEFSQLASDDKLHEQLIRISVDPLTGISNRYAYNQKIADYKKQKELPKDLVVFSIDLNGLKKINDNLGHIAGDELICGASKCIENVFNKYGKCYRTGGDEFMCFVETSDDKVIDEIMASLKDNTDNWEGKVAKDLSLSIGYAKASSDSSLSIENLVSLADQMMYIDKRAYYEKNGFPKRA